MISVSISSLSTVYYQQLILVTAPEPYDPSGDIVQFAFIPESYPIAQPGSGDWNAGSWAAFPTGQWAQCLIGPAGGLVLGQGRYLVWVKITDSPEVPVLQDVLLQVGP